MLNAEQTLTTAIGHLSRLSTAGPASFDELVALSAARVAIDELFHNCSNELRADPQVAPVWSAIASAIESQAKRGPSKKISYGAQKADSNADAQVLRFWRTFAPQFAWDFLPSNFLYALYVHWMAQQFPRDTPHRKKALMLRLKDAAATSGDWFHSRSRPGSMMDAPEPLAARAPGWTRVRSDEAIYGLRRSGV
jgi:hypothetical protein